MQSWSYKCSQQSSDNNLTLPLLTALLDLSKAYDCIVHNLLIAKLEAYGFDRDSLKFMYIPTGRGQRAKVGSSYSSLGKIKIGVSQGSVLGPMLFSIFANDFVYD